MLRGLSRRGRRPGDIGFLAMLAELLAGWFGNRPFWTNVGVAFLVSVALQLSYLLGLLSVAMGRRIMAFFKIKQEKARMAVAEPSLSYQPLVTLALAEPRI